jgi:hypothetical protein
MDKKNNNGFPSHLEPAEVKQQKDWLIQFARAAKDVSRNGGDGLMFHNMAEQYAQWRDLARGKQNPDQYKPQLGIKKGRNNKSWKALDWSILPIAPKFVNIMTGKLMESWFGVKFEPIDPKSEAEKKEYESQVYDYVVNKDLYAQIEESTGHMMGNPIPAGEPVPNTNEEIKQVTDMHYKNRYAMELTDAFKLVDDKSKLKQQMYLYGKDLVETGVGVLKQTIDHSTTLPKIKRVEPERMITSRFIQEDGSDIQWAGEFHSVTLTELKEWAQGELSKQELEKLERMAVEGNGIGYDYYNLSYQDRGVPKRESQGRFIVLELYLFSVDQWVHEAKPNKFGNVKLHKRPSNFPYSRRDKTPMSDEDYEKKYQGSKIIRREVRNVYKIHWVVDTDICFRYGLQTNMPRAISDLQETQLPYVVNTTGFDSIIRLIEPVIHNCQLNWLQYQNHIARSTPSGLEIEMTALENISLGAKQQKLTPKEVLRMYMDTGILLWRRKNWNNASNQWRPIQELRNGLNESAAEHFNNIIKNIDLLRNILGISEVEDASTPNPQILKSVAEMAALGTNNALSFLYNAFENGYIQSARTIALLIPDSRLLYKDHPGFSNALGQQSDSFWIEMQSREMGVVPEKGADQSVRDKLSVYIQKSIDAQMITPDEAFAIENEDNIYRAYRMLRQFREEREAKAATQQQQAIAAKAQSDRETAQISAQIEEQKNMSKAQSEILVLDAQIEGELAKEREKARLEQVLKKVEQGIELSKQERELLNQLTIQDHLMEWKMKIENSKPKPKKLTA